MTARASFSSASHKHHHRDSAARSAAKEVIETCSRAPERVPARLSSAGDPSASATATPRKRLGSRASASSIAPCRAHVARPHQQRRASPRRCRAHRKNYFSTRGRAAFSCWGLTSGKRDAGPEHMVMGWRRHPARRDLRSARWSRGGVHAAADMVAILACCSGFYSASMGRRLDPYPTCRVARNELGEVGGTASYLSSAEVRKRPSPPHLHRSAHALERRSWMSRGRPAGPTTPHLHAGIVFAEPEIFCAPAHVGRNDRTLDGRHLERPARAGLIWPMPRGDC